MATTVRGATEVPAGSASGEVAAAPAGGYARSGDTFSGSFTVASLLGTCPNAAFAHDLDVDAKATDGTRRLSGYDAGFLRAFALAQMPAREPVGTTVSHPDGLTLRLSGTRRALEWRARVA